MTMTLPDLVTKGPPPWAGKTPLEIALESKLYGEPLVKEAVRIVAELHKEQEIFRRWGLNDHSYSFEVVPATTQYGTDHKVTYSPKGSHLTTFTAVYVVYVHFDWPGEDSMWMQRDLVRVKPESAGEIIWAPAPWIDQYGEDEIKTAADLLRVVRGYKEEADGNR